MERHNLGLASVPCEREGAREHGNMDKHNRQEIKNKHEGNMGTEKGHMQTQRGTRDTDTRRT